MAKKKILFKFQAGPVQEFIAQARSTRDLWSGSYLLSWLVAHGVLAAKDKLKEDCRVALPVTKPNPLLDALSDKPIGTDDKTKALIPNMPNQSLTILALENPEEEIRGIAEAVGRGMRDELGRIGDCVWDFLEVPEKFRGQWDAQVEAFLQYTWGWTEIGEGDNAWKDAYGKVGKMLAARRNVRDFAQWAGVEGVVKDSLSGKEEAIGDDAFWRRLKKDYPMLFRKNNNHRYGAINLIKRCWAEQWSRRQKCLKYLTDSLDINCRDFWKATGIPSLPEIARKNSIPGMTEEDRKKYRNPYVAVLAMDGDKMGEKVSECNKTPEGLTEFSAKLSDFALNNVKRIVKGHDGCLIYAGGDDVLAILPSTNAIACAEELRNVFNELTGCTASAGLAVGHVKAPLQMLVKSAQRMESVAKNKYGRNALAVALYKRSGEIVEWGAKWGDGATALMREVTELTQLTQEKKLSGRFPYALAGALAQYALKGEIDGTMKEVVMAETEVVLERQGSKAIAEKLHGPIEKYLNTVEGRAEDFANLFLAETFLNRMRGGDDGWEDGEED